jgi:oxygen-independent coproporphyrinogen-3 oxidase
MIGIYIHIPFCRSKCDYCAFFSQPLSREDHLDRYVDSLVREMRFRLDGLGNPGIDTLYIGGGTPSLLNPRQVESLVSEIEKRGIMASEPECTLEINPEDVDRQYLHSLKNAGINRFVLGIQSLDRKTLSFLGRKASVDPGERLEAFFSLEGCNKGVDIITGVPALTGRILEDELENILDFEPDHLSLYSLSLEPGTPLADRFVPGDDFDEMQVDQYERARRLIETRGLARYEVSNFARPGRMSRHNLKYWNYEPYAGFGPGSHSLIEGERFFNGMSLDDYMNRERPILERDARSREDVLVEIVMTGLRRVEGMVLEESAERAEIEIPEEVIHRMEAHPALVVERMDSGTRVRVRDEHLLVTDSLVYRCMEPWISYPAREKASRAGKGGVV